MNMLYEKIKDKRVAIWGTGILASDITGLFHFEKLLYYVDDFKHDAQESAIDTGKQIHPSGRLINEDRTDLFILICEQDEDYAARRLKEMGFQESDYAFGEDLLVDCTLFDTIKNKSIYIWGTGNTYTYHKKELSEYVGGIQSFFVSKTDGNPANLEGRPVEPFSKEKVSQRDSFIIVCSIYYKEIAVLLQQNGYAIGKNFINVRTFSTLGRLSTNSTGAYAFVGRKKNAEELLVILSGYKKFVWESVFPRIKQYAPHHFDVAVVTSGLVNEELQDMCERYGWSYISTQRNNVSLALNLSISLFPKAKYIYKLDEDIFVTKGCFEAMRNTYDWLEDNSRYEVGFVTPLIPVNGYGYVRLLEFFHCVELWEERFGELAYTDCYRHHRTIHDSPDAALFMWGDGNRHFADIDAMAEKLGENGSRYSICPIRYSIGLILFTRRNWMRMGMFPVLSHLNLGADEEHISKFCLLHARVMAVAENAIAGHLSYGPQHKIMEEYYKTHREQFLLKKIGNP